MAIFQIEGEEVIEKEVGNGGESGRIYINKKYIGLNVKIVIPSGLRGNGGVKGDRGGELEQ
ncbi:MAG: DUF2080 family transposase-associated protein [Nitrospirota bacterium]|nr:DUF2080 family transposase-associated protein [Nitrospirota bacterium]